MNGYRQETLETRLWRGVSCGTMEKCYGRVATPRYGIPETTRGYILNNNINGTASGRPLPSYVYLLWVIGTTRYKIGRTTNPSQRIQDLQFQSPFPLKLIGLLYTEDCIEQELRLHRLAADYRVRGEWFELPRNWVQQKTIWFDNPDCTIFPKPPFCSLSQKPIEPKVKKSIQLVEKIEQGLELPPKMPVTKEQFDLAFSLLGHCKKVGKAVSKKTKKKVIELLGTYPTPEQTEVWKHNLKKMGFATGSPEVKFNNLGSQDGVEL